MLTDDDYNNPRPALNISEVYSHSSKPDNLQSKTDEMEELLIDIMEFSIKKDEKENDHNLIG
ncbi:hypothetical protein TorRG33x02_144600 [Trema orientale]|uniref:Uncharacterized protein n=1 Tax=Trema orientale TaxID=63057 RepID=A0A2P5EW72_TREOI|nr:hypothetical protein TorRG33x02_144600 [Trema orientale]